MMMMSFFAIPRVSLPLFSFTCAPTPLRNEAAGPTVAEIHILFYEFVPQAKS
jgi:hypothetical protein